MKQVLLTSCDSKKQIYSNLQGSSLPLAIAEFCTNTTGIKLVITENNLIAEQLRQELTFFYEAEYSQEILLFPDWETLPYDHFSPHQDIISARLNTLNQIQQQKNAIIITAASTAMHQLCPPSFVLQHGLVLKISQKIQVDNFREQLTNAGYNCVNQVFAHGEFAVRGAIIDLFPMGSKLPIRIELFDDEIDSLRYFDPDNQCTVEKVNSINILPAHEFPLDEEGISQFRQSFREQFDVAPMQCPIYEAVSSGRAAGGIEYFLPLFFTHTASIFDYLPKDSSVLYVGDIAKCAERFWDEVNKQFNNQQGNITKPLLNPNQCFITPVDFLTRAKTFSQIRMIHESLDKKGNHFNFDTDEPKSFPIAKQSDEPLQSLNDYITQQQKRTLLVMESAGRREAFIELLKKSNIHPKVQTSWQNFLDDDDLIQIIIAPLQAGAELANISIIVEAQVFGTTSVPQQRKRKKYVDPDLIVRNLVELQVGSPVVHVDYGVGRYQGLQVINNQGVTSEFLVLTYANDDKIFVPITSLDLISRYTGADPDNAPLHHLGNQKWQNEKKKASAKIHDTAVELLEIYARREANTGFVYQCEITEYQHFTSLFPFHETEDQSSTITQIINDMESVRPMDRLICGDVGFGKTEVAMRAAFIAAQNNKQVGILVPTTLLAGQHFTNFSDRFADFPINIELLSRFRSPKEVERVLQGLTDGTVDIVIATHKLLQRDIKFKNLGLLIIDEEHRFGVKQKEHIKSLRTQVDILSMTATPIPRTLNMAMSGIRDISLITTPPAKRMAVKTFWQQREDHIIREAILREIMRGGQVFFLHNKVQTIDNCAERIQSLVPEAKIRVAHGQMRERELESIMSDFYHQRFNVLVCSTIIENGIDIPSANTILIDKADNFGLAQLHQLRGRVGRSHHQAYAYLLTADRKLLNKDAVKRLEAIVSLEDLGAGFTLATHDLEIRGTGELLGDEQSGHIHAIGFSLYMEMLERAVNDLKAGKIPELESPIHQGPEINLNIGAIIPETYIGDIHTRLIIYKRINSAENAAQLDNLKIELIDRFGLLPDEVKLLFLTTELKSLAQKIGVERIQGANSQGKISLQENASINPASLIELLSQKPQHFKMAGPTALAFNFDDYTPDKLVQEIKVVLQNLAR